MRETTSTQKALTPEQQAFIDGVVLRVSYQLGSMIMPLIPESALSPTDKRRVSSKVHKEVETPVITKMRELLAALLEDES
ncbi:MAG: hypothetical protein E6J34_22220 [Chloroflexi bacterium]|nr:MAG: hypothetical protein E6J34_22220 [Chloroflexota bacterium]